MSFNHERQEGSSYDNSMEEESKGLGIVGTIVGGGLLMVLGACVLYTLAGAAIAIGTLAVKGVIAVSIALAVMASILAAAGMLRESLFGDDEAFA